MKAPALNRMTFSCLFLITLLLMGGCSSQPNPELNLGGIDVGEAFNGMISRVHQIMGGVSSLDSVDKALPQLQAVSSDFDDLLFNSQKLSPAGQTELSILALKAAPEMEALVKQVNSSPPIGKVLGGTMEEILGKLMKLI